MSDLDAVAPEVLGASVGDDKDDKISNNSDDESNAPGIPSCHSLPSRAGKHRHIADSGKDLSRHEVELDLDVEQPPDSEDELLGAETRSSKAPTKRKAAAEHQQGGTMTVTAAITNLVTCMIGASVLSLPRMVAMNGWAFGPLMVAVAACVSYRASVLVDQAVDATTELQGRRPGSIGEVALECWGLRGKRTVLILTSVFQISKVAVYFVVIGTNLHFWADTIPQRTCSIIGAGFCMRLVFLRDITVISRWSFIGVIAAGFYLFTITIAGLSAAAMSDRPTAGLLPVDYHDVLANFAVMLYAYSPSDVVPVLKRDMKEPKDLRCALFWSHVTVASIYVLIGTVGYLGWGRDVQGNVLLSMCDEPGCPGALPEVAAPGAKWVLGYILSFAVVSNLMVTVPVVLYCVFRMFENEYEHLQTGMANTLLRATVVTGSLTIALTMPFFIEILGVISTVLLTTLQVFVPVSMTLALSKRGVVQYGKCETFSLFLGGLIFL
ncbi:unnamed protein product, partial [Polarella glacialis]